MTTTCNRLGAVLFTFAALASLSVASIARDQIVIRAGQLLDGKGGAARNAVIAVEGSRIASVGQAAPPRMHYDFTRLTVMPGMIDTHVHLRALAQRVRGARLCHGRLHGRRARQPAHRSGF